MGGLQGPPFLPQPESAKAGDYREREEGLPDHAQKELPLTALGRKPVMLVWTGAVLTQFGNIVKEKTAE